MDDHAVQLLETSAVELQHLEAGSDVPDMDEGDVRELTAPLGGDADTAQEGHDHVAEALAAVEALVGVAPHAVDGMDALGLSDDILEGHLDVVIDVVGVAVDHVEFSHDDGIKRRTCETSKNNRLLSKAAYFQ